MSHMDMGSSDSTCESHMLWNWKVVDACFLSESWQITNNGMFAASCIGVMLLVVVLEFVRRVGKEYDTFILRQFQQHIAAQTALSKSAGDDACCSDLPSPGPQTVTFRATPLQQLIRSVIHAVAFGLAYIIMLIAMGFNGYIIISIIIGAGIGKFVCDWMIQKVVVGDGSQQAKGLGGIDDTTMCCG
ncbi:Uu.00g051050.m01.CDS01 [Anthostomella pinea]|uniref:Copper transport protein n=1 Tax=Anthostomella pinea TaxID=933095 RepID=A0AAI8VSS1_9PEZI|nr:Uu.00g051050.m01.CDS01 [Anthostomella pinea]